MNIEQFIKWLKYHGVPEDAQFQSADGLIMYAVVYDEPNNKVILSDVK